MVDDAILVTGVAGLLGRAVADSFAAEGASVLGLDRRKPDGFGSAFAIDDLSDVDRLARRFAGAAAVIHCAAIARLGDAAEAVIYDNNVSTTAHVAFAAEKAGVARLVYASSQSALGFAYAPVVVAPAYVPIDEDHPAAPVEAYGLSKLTGERLCEMVSRRGGPTCLALRFPVIWVERLFAENTRRRLDNPVQAAKSQWAYIDLRDAAQACRIAASAPAIAPFRIYNIAAPWPFDMDDAVAQLTAHYGAAIETRMNWRPGDAVFASDRARTELGFTAQWRWSRDGIHFIEAC